MLILWCDNRTSLWASKKLVFYQLPNRPSPISDRWAIWLSIFTHSWKSLSCSKWFSAQAVTNFLFKALWSRHSIGIIMLPSSQKLHWTLFINSTRLYRNRTAFGLLSFSLNGTRWFPERLLLSPCLVHPWILWNLPDSERRNFYLSHREGLQWLLRFFLSIVDNEEYAWIIITKNEPIFSKFIRKLQHAMQYILLSHNEMQEAFLVFDWYFNSMEDVVLL